MTDPQIQSVNNPLLTDQQVVEEVDQERLGELLPEDTIKANVRKRIDVICHS